jgi:hypothetical protein
MNNEGTRPRILDVMLSTDKTKINQESLDWFNYLRFIIRRFFEEFPDGYHLTLWLLVEDG